MSQQPGRTLPVVLFCVAAAAMSLPSMSVAAKARPQRKPRTFKTAPPPKFTPEVTATFFDDARQKLGPGQPGGAIAAATPKAGGASDEGDAVAATGDAAWSKLIAGSTIEDEVKAQVGSLAEVTKTPSVFKGGGNHVARVHFTELAMLFGVVAQFDGDVRGSWKKDALGLREIFRRAGGNCKVGTDNSYKEAHQRSDDLAQLISGGKIELPKPDPDAKWSDVANRAPLMTRMGKEGYDPKIKAWTSDKGEFSKNRNALLEEAQIVAVIAHLIQDPSYEYADDEDYLKYAKGLETQALEIVEAVKGDDLQRAQKAAGQLNKACSTCHEGYRSGG
ncbi:MAG TPA: cytochrome c [Pirellulales bacterium]|nr:cytochrome c [Pirellulales bacterium]